MSTVNNVSLSQADRDFLSKLPAEMRQTAETHLLTSKVTAMSEVKARREIFNVSLSETVKNQDGSLKAGSGGYKVTGLGSRFPVTLYPEQWEVIFSNIEKIRACYNDPANKAKSDALRK